MAETPLSRDRKRINHLKRERTSYEAHWRDLAENFLPRKGRYQLSDTNRGEKRHQRIINSAGLQAVRTISSGMMAGLTSPARPWFRMTTRDPDLAERPQVKAWLHQVELRIRDKFNRSNLYNVLPGMYKELAVFGTASLAQLEDERETFRFYPFTIGSYWLALDQTLRVDTFARQFAMTVRQQVMQFGLDKVSPTVRMQYQRGDYEEMVQTIHYVTRNDERDAGQWDNRNMPWRGCYFDENAQDASDYLLREGFNEFPILTARWDVTGEDIYGSSPGMDALGDGRAIQLQERRKAQAIDKLVDPPYVADAAMRKNGARPSLLPGSVTFSPNMQTSGGIRPVYEIKPDINALVMDIQSMEKRVQSAFYSDLFLLTAMSDRRDVTATEIAERHEEKLMALGPILERLNDELFDPLLDRTVSIMFRSGQLPPPPREMEGKELKIEYINMLSQSQKLIQSTGTERFFGFAAQVIAIAQDSAAKVDFDQMLDEYAGDVGVAPKIVRSDDEVGELRERQQREKQMAQMAQMAKPMADGAQAVKTLTETVPQDGNIGAAFAESMGGMV